MLLLAIFLVIPALTSAQDQVNVTEIITRFFSAVDVDSNGLVSRPEIEMFFDAMDQNHDDKINRHEFETYMSTIDPFLGEHHSPLYDMYDINGDNHVDHTDFDLSWVQHDLDGDGQLSLAEFSVPPHPINGV